MFKMYRFIYLLFPLCIWINYLVAHKCNVLCNCTYSVYFHVFVQNVFFELSPEIIFFPIFWERCAIKMLRILWVSGSFSVSLKKKRKICGVGGRKPLSIWIHENKTFSPGMKTRDPRAVTHFQEYGSLTLYTHRGVMAWPRVTVKKIWLHIWVCIWQESQKQHDTTTKFWVTPAAPAFSSFTCWISGCGFLIGWAVSFNVLCFGVYVNSLFIIIDPNILISFEYWYHPYSLKSVIR